MALLEVQDVSKHFPGVQALTSVNMAVEPGEVHALVGQNGAGKSTLVKILSGAQPPDGGQVIFDGSIVQTYTPRHATSLGIGVVYQRMELLPFLSVAENILMGQLPGAGHLVFNRSEAHQISRRLLRRFGLDLDPEIAVSRLSPAERQEVAIAKALFRRAKLLILDEPTAALDISQIERLFGLVEDLKHQGVAILYISHHLEEIFRLADRITVLRDSRVVSTQMASELNQTEVVTLMAGRRIDVAVDVAKAEGSARSPAELRTPSLEFRHIRAGALQDIDFKIHAGEVVGVTGVIGAGGHDIARVLFGLDKAQTGDILLDGKVHSPSGPRKAIDAGLFMVPEDPSRQGLVAVLSIASNITLVDLKPIKRAGLLSIGKERRVARRYVDELDIRTRSVDTAVRNLSGGNQQKVLIAKSLQAKAKVLVMEEPTQGVDVQAKAEIHRIIRRLGSEGKTVVVISTDIRDLLEFVDRMIVLRAGRIVGQMNAEATSYAQVLDLTVGATGALAS